MAESNKIVNNFIWRFAERCGAQVVSFIVSIVLARILDPEDYGLISLVLVFTTIFQVFVDSGLGTALIQKKDADELDFSSVFFFNLGACIILYIIIYFVSPLIAKFYNDDSLITVIRVIGITILISGVKGIQQAYVSRNMLFKRFFFSTLGGTVFSAFLGIYMAYRGYGVWALVMQQLSNNAIDTLILWLTVKWRPKLMFSWERLKKLLSFGWKLLVSALIDTVYNNLRNLIIGKMYSASDLAFYNQGDKFPKVIVSNINSSLDSVLLPTMSNVQDSHSQVKSMTRWAIKMSTYIMAPLMMGLSFCATPIVKLILTEKWLPCVPFLRIFCITYMFWPIHTANLNAINAMGRSDLFLKLEIMKKVIGLILLFTTMRISVMVMAYSLLLSSLISQIINSWPNRKLLNYGYLEQIKDISPSIILAIGMGGIISSIQYLKLSPLVTLSLQIPLGAILYISGSILFKLDTFEYVKGLLGRFKRR